MPQFNCAVFDVDGTLLDTSEGFVSSVRYTLEKYGLEPLSDKEIRSFIGPPIQESFNKLYHFSDDVIAHMAATFRDHYKSVDLLKAHPYEGIYDALIKLKEAGMAVVIATYKRQDYAATLLEHFGFQRYTDQIFGSDFEGKLKKRDIIRLALRGANVCNHAEAVMIGDSDNDALGAEEVGAAFLGVTYGFGFRSKDEIEHFNAVGAANTPDEIAEILLGG